MGIDTPIGVFSKGVNLSRLKLVNMIANQTNKRKYNVNKTELIEYIAGKSDLS
jgi:hypothetical protein